jgi:uncharacterized membrane protein
MFIHKIFHLRQPLNEARARLRAPGTWDGADTAVSVHCADASGHLAFSSREGTPISADIVEVPGEEEDRILFRSVCGEVEVAGIIELFPIRPNLTEAVLTMEYDAPSGVQSVIERITVGLDQFLNRQLAKIERARAGAELCA